MVHVLQPLCFSTSEGGFDDEDSVLGRCGVSADALHFSTLPGFSNFHLSGLE